MTRSAGQYGDQGRSDKPANTGRPTAPNAPGWFTRCSLDRFIIVFFVTGTGRREFSRRSHFAHLPARDAWRTRKTSADQLRSEGIFLRQSPTSAIDTPTFELEHEAKAGNVSSELSDTSAPHLRVRA
jgi:hypothetical protein